ncbi:tyrosine-type recombinase/integrase [Streptomyces sp. ME19-01-6]|uniref:tyrosine-type recombinase/integrase n=1 Tax=Streptomyces sp. ME19-01-6 TaxID=3028686 RepID=UPI0029ABF79A|nr:tyrosine-type recombinase/integrase [Streptomyces sp. ME19-01-6]MDX3224475.1 tyrosine-type recombinase/integrase [Streptomyces sp. ME19-01-6]
MNSPNFYRRCQCKGPLTDKAGKPVLNGDGSPKIGDIGLTCPKLRRKGHGTWYFALELEPGENGKRRRPKRGGFPTKEKAEEAAEKLYKEAERGADVLSDETMADYLRRWIETKKKLARTTRHGYQEHLDNYLVPHLGHIKRRDLRVRHLDLMYNAIERENAERILHRLRVEELTEARDAAHRAWVRAAGKKEERRRTRRAYLDANAALREGRRGLRKVTSAATMHRINDTLSSAITWGMKREDAFSRNWARLVELPTVTRPKPLVWTPERVDHWKRTGEKPGPVMVWTPEQTGAFLDFARDDWLYDLWHSFIFLGPRRGELCALPKREVNLGALWLRISAQIVEVAYRLYGEAPKADSLRTVSLSHESAEVLGQGRARRDKAREEWSGVEAWVESDRFFTHENGEPLHPDWMSRRFKRLVELSGLPPVRLHDLRHISASLSLLQGHDIKVVQERLGHSSRQITSDTYTSVLPELARREAESISSVIPRTVPYDVLRPLAFPQKLFSDGMAVVYAEAARTRAGVWTISVKARHDGRSLGKIKTAATGQENATLAAVQWVRDHCQHAELRILSADKMTAHVSERGQPGHLARFVIDGGMGMDPEGWAPVPLGPSDSDTSKQDQEPSQGAV